MAKKENTPAVGIQKSLDHRRTKPIVIEINIIFKYLLMPLFISA